MSIHFLKELKSNPYFSAADCFYFHLLPDVEYYAGVYETSFSSFAALAGCDRNTAKNFFEKLERSGLVMMLRNGKTRGKNSTVAFCRNESTLHNYNYLRNGTPSSSLRDRNLYYIETSKDNVIPKNFFKAPPSEIIFTQLLIKLNDVTLANDTVKTILDNEILTDAHRRRNRVARVG